MSEYVWLIGRRVDQDARGNVSAPLAYSDPLPETLSKRVESGELVAVKVLKSEAEALKPGERNVVKDGRVVRVLDPEMELSAEVEVIRKEREQAIVEEAKTRIAERKKRAQ